MFIQVIPDIHNKIYEANEIIDKEQADKVVFLGDYFDDFNDTMEETHQTAYWLKQQLDNPDRICLLGNHDLSYLNPHFACAGFTEGKLFAIKNTGVNLAELKYYCWVGDWLCTHAGLSYDFYNAYNVENLPVESFMPYMIEENRDRLFNVSTYRGGRDAHSGIVWCDYDEFVDIPNYKQIFGHTHGRKRKTEGGSYCIDTWLKYYGLYDTDTKKMVIKKV